MAMTLTLGICSSVNPSLFIYITHTGPIWIFFSISMLNQAGDVLHELYFHSFVKETECEIKENIFQS